MNRSIPCRPARLRPILATVTLLVLALVLTACGGTSNGSTMNGMPGMGGSTTQAASAAPFDQQFIDMMVPHHMSAVEMATIAQTRGERPEIKTLADSIIADQNKEIAQMKQWRMAWFGSDQTPAMDQMPMLPGLPSSDMKNMSANGTMNMTTEINALKTAQPFDKAFINAMIPHHQSAIDAAKIAQDKGQHAEIKTLAGNIITSQQKEIDQMQQWLKAWYG